MLRLRDLQLTFADRVLFDGLSWHVRRGQRIGLVGDNGVGKTTLLKVMIGEQAPDAGKVQITRGVELGYLSQNFSFSSSRPVLQVVLDGAESIRRLETRIQELEARLVSLDPESDAFLKTVDQLGRLRDRFEHAGGFRLESQARRVLAGLGFKDPEMERPLDEFSGGWQMRVALASLLVQRPDLLLLDEPTNHLDIDTIEWLERFLQTYEGTVVVVSHDRFFLDRMVSQVTWLGPLGLREFTGNYTQFCESLEQERERLGAQATRDAKEEARVQRFIDRFKAKATKATQVQSRIRMLEKRERVVVEDEASTIEFRFPPCARAGDQVLELIQVAQRYGDNTVFERLDLSIDRGERIALVGPNGAGKSTLMRLIAAIEAPAAGQRKLGHKVQLATYTQEFESSLDPTHTLLEEIAVGAEGLTDTQLRSLLGQFRFPGGDVFKKVEVLSGGEKSRLAVAKLLLQPTNFLVLDEPTNHLDLKSKGVLQQALGSYEGTLLIVSHDRYFLDGVVDRVLEIRDGGMRDFRGDYSHYLWLRDRQAQDREGMEPQGEGGKTPSRRREDKKAASAERMRRRKLLRQKQKAVETVEKELAEVEARIDELEALMSDEGLYSDAEKLAETSREHARQRTHQGELLERWETAQVELDETQTELEEPDRT